VRLKQKHHEVVAAIPVKDVYVYTGIGDISADLDLTLFIQLVLLRRLEKRVHQCFCLLKMQPFIYERVRELAVYPADRIFARKQQKPTSAEPSGYINQAYKISLRVIDKEFGVSRFAHIKKGKCVEVRAIRIHDNALI